MITVTRIGKHLGAEISGVDLSQPLSDDAFVIATTPRVPVPRTA